ncbi:MerT protein [Leptotrichia trevisanii]
MKKNENKFMSKVKSFLVLVLFTVIYFFFQKTIYPALAFLFWLIFAMPLTEIIINALEFLHLPQVDMTTIAVVISGIALIMVLIVVFGLGYLCSKFLKKMDKTVLGCVMTAILIYFLYKVFTETDESTAMFAPKAREIHIFCTVSHIFYTIGVFFSDKVKKVLDRIKFSRKK